MKATCPTCNGAGWLISLECPWCQGTGVMDTDDPMYAGAIESKECWDWENSKEVS